MQDFFSFLSAQPSTWVWKEETLLWFGRKIINSGLAGKCPTLVWQADILLWFGTKIINSGLAGR